MLVFQENWFTHKDCFVYNTRECTGIPAQDQNTREYKTYKHHCRGEVSSKLIYKRQTHSVMDGIWI